MIQSSAQKNFTLLSISCSHPAWWPPPGPSTWGEPCAWRPTIYPPNPSCEALSCSLTISQLKRIFHQSRLFYILYCTFIIFALKSFFLQAFDFEKCQIVPQSYYYTSLPKAKGGQDSLCLLNVSSCCSLTLNPLTTIPTLFKIHYRPIFLTRSDLIFPPTFYHLKYYCGKVHAVFFKASLGSNPEKNKHNLDITKPQILKMNKTGPELTKHLL